MIIAISNETCVMPDIAHKIGKNKSVVYIDTASNGQAGDMTWRENQVRAVEKEFWVVDRYSIEWKKLSDFHQDLYQYDVILMWWWNTAYLLPHIKNTGFDEYLRGIQDFKIIIGSSAGAKVLGKNIGHVKPLDDFSIVPSTDYTGLWLLNFDIWAHFGKEKYREKYNEVLDVAYDTSQSWVYISDNSYIISTDTGIQICNV